ncbi:hypothetical protein KC926_03320 [Candidatus Kaiserbacteria bacterium]|nr:hypothetical protein [Candidatus Kaiserbacteria bacterium]
MDENKKLNETLVRIEQQQDKLFSELTGLIKESTTAVVEIKNSIRPPYWKTEGFFFKLLIMVCVFVISYVAISNNGCFEIFDFAVIGCENK